jgi:hypothetical protein
VKTIRRNRQNHLQKSKETIKKGLSFPDSRNPLKVNRKFPKKTKIDGKLTVLIVKGGVCLFNKNLREVSVSFKTRGDVSVILINLRGG